MKKFAAIALALILAMSSMFATVAVATNGGETVSGDNKLAFAGFEIKDKGVVIDVEDSENMKIYGLKPLLEMDKLGDYLVPGDGFTVKAVDENGNEVNYLGTGTKLILNDGKEDYPFTVVIFGDLTGDSAIDVIDAAMAQRYHTGDVTPTDLALIAGDSDKDGEISADDYSLQVNAAVGNKEIDQNATGSEDAGILEVADQVYTSQDITDYKAILDEDVTLTFNDVEIDAEHYDIGSCTYEQDPETHEFYGKVDITGKGLFKGTVTIRFEVVSLLEKVVATVNEVIEDANLANVVEAKYELVDGVADIKVNVNASKIIRGQFDVDMNGLNGLLTKIDEFKARHLQEVSLTVGDLAIANNGDFDRSAIKALVFDIAKGIFCDIANADDNVVKSYSGSLVTNNELAELTENFNIDVVMTADADIDIDRVKAFAAKVARYVAFDVVDGNAVIDLVMPAGFATKVVDVLSNGTGDVEAAKAAFDELDVGSALGYLAKVSPEDISAGSVEEIEQALSVATKLVALVNKALGEVNTATVTDVNGNVYELLNGSSFAPDEANSDKVNAFVTAVGKMLNDAVLDATVGNFCKDGIYTVAADVAIDYRNISETIIVNFDLFTAVETPDVIEETAVFFDSIIKDLGISNVAAVSYDEDSFRGLVTVNATQLLAGNLQFNDTALDGLYSDIKGYFDETYGEATIVVDGYEIVTDGAINKSALKGYLFDFVSGFFADVADINGENIIRSSAVVVTEADGTVHKFDLDFQLTGDPADVAKVASISGKVADYVSLDTTSGNAVVNVAMPVGMTNKIIDTIGSGSVEAAKAALNDLDVGDLLGYVAKVSAEDISASNADEINTIVEMVAGMDALVNKLLGKVASATAYDVNGNAMALLSGDAFVVEEASIAGISKAVALALSEDVINSTVANFVNADGIYTITCDVALTVGGIKETVVLNVDIFGDLADEVVPEETKDAIEETVDYVGDIITDLGISNVASVAYSDGKAVATFDADEILAGNLVFDDKALDGLYTEVKDYFKSNYGDSTIKVGDYELVTDGAINKSAVKDFVFDFATGFFTDLANMDADTLRSYNAVVVDANGEAESFVFDFAIAGEPENLEKIQSIAGKVADHVSFTEVNGNAVVSLSAPEGMTDKIVGALQATTVEEAKEKLNALTVEDLLGTYVYNVSAEDISASSAEEIETIVEMVAGMDAVVNKLLGKVSDATVEIEGTEISVLNGNDFVVEDATISGLVSAFGKVLTDDILGANLSNFVNPDGSYTIELDVGLSVGGIKETVVINFDIF